MIAGILLAAGESTRMGELKALLPWRGTTLVQSQAAQMLEAGIDPLIVVLGHRADELRRLLPGQAKVVLNARYAEGKSTSIVAGVSALPPNAEAALIVAVDQPTDAAIFLSLMQAHGQGAIVLTSIHNRRGHPTLFAPTVVPELQSITEEREGLREVMIRHEQDIAYVSVDTELVRANLNSPPEYEAAYARWGKG